MIAFLEFHPVFTITNTILPRFDVQLHSDNFIALQYHLIKITELAVFHFFDKNTTLALYKILQNLTRAVNFFGVLTLLLEHTIKIGGKLTDLYVIRLNLSTHNIKSLNKKVLFKIFMFDGIQQRP